MHIVIKAIKKTMYFTYLLNILYVILTFSLKLNVTKWDGRSKSNGGQCKYDKSRNKVNQMIKINNLIRIDSI